MPKVVTPSLVQDSECCLHCCRHWPAVLAVVEQRPPLRQLAVSVTDPPIVMALVPEVLEPVVHAVLGVVWKTSVGQSVEVPLASAQVSCKSQP